MQISERGGDAPCSHGGIPMAKASERELGLHAALGGHELVPLIHDDAAEAGELLFIDNHDAFHGRTPFRFHGRADDRWLLRTFITRDFSRSRVHRPGDGRIVDTDYAKGADVMPYNRTDGDGVADAVVLAAR